MVAGEAWRPELDPQNPCGRRESIPQTHECTYEPGHRFKGGGAGSLVKITWPSTSCGGHVAEDDFESLVLWLLPLESYDYRYMLPMITGICYLLEFKQCWGLNSGL